MRIHVDVAGYRAKRREALAAFTQAGANNVLSVILLTGFKAISTNRAQSVLAKPVDVNVKNGIAGQLLAKCTPVKNRKTMEGRITPQGGTATVIVVGTNSRRMEFNGLTPGVLYTIELRATGGSTGFSDWSDPVQHRAL